MAKGGFTNITEARQIEGMKRLPIGGSTEYLVARGDATVFGRMVTAGSPFVEKVKDKGSVGWKLTKAGIDKLNSLKAA